MKTVHTIAHNDILLKTGAVIAATIFWYLFSGIHSTTLSVTVPLYFYNVDNYPVIQAPEKIRIVLEGKRSHLYALDTTHMAAHINADHLKPGKQPIILTEAELFLPPSIKLVHYNPLNIAVTLNTTGKEIVTS